MLTLSFGLCACLLVMLAWPDLPIARRLHAAMIAPLANVLAALSAGHWLMFLGLVTLAGLAAWAGPDAIVMLALGSPELAAGLMTFEVAAYLDAAVAVIAAAGAMRGLSPRQWIARLPRPRATRSRPARRTTRTAANDDDPAPALRVA